MRNETGAAAAAVRSAMYRDVRRDVEPRPAPEAAAEPPADGRNEAGTARERAPSRESSRLTAVALLGLLDLLQGA